MLLWLGAILSFIGYFVSRVYMIVLKHEPLSLFHMLRPLSREHPASFLNSIHELAVRKSPGLHSSSVSRKKHLERGYKYDCHRSAD